MSEIRADKLHNASGDNDSGIDLSTNDQVSIKTADTTRATVDSSGNMKFDSGFGSVTTVYGVKAWVNFDGTGTAAIDGSGNIASLTDNDTGSYSITLTVAMPDTNYAGPNSIGGSNGVTDLSSKSTTQYNLFTRNLSGSQQDQSTVDIGLIR